MSSKFFSITKFVEFMNDKYNNPSGVIVYFEASQAFMSKFDKICVKPVMINVCHSVAHAPAGSFQKLKDVYIKHEDIIKMFDGQLILTFTENRSRHLPRDKQNLYYLTIDFNQKEYNGFTYYKTEMFQSMNTKNVELIRKQIIRHNKEGTNTERKQEFTQEFAQEHEIPPDAF